MKEWKPKTVNMENGKAGHTCCPLLPFIGFQRSQPACCLSHPFLRLTGEHRIYPTGRAYEESPSSTELIHISSSSSSSFAVWYWHGGCKLKIRLGISHHTSAYWSFAVFLSASSRYVNDAQLKNIHPEFIMHKQVNMIRLTLAESTSEINWWLL